MKIIERIETKHLMNIWGKVEMPDGPGGCWIWTGARGGGKNGDDYPRVYWTFDGVEKRLAVHRLMWCLHHGRTLADIADKHMHHKCGNPLCVRPDHLEPVTANMHAIISNLQKHQDIDGYAAYLAAQEAYAYEGEDLSAPEGADHDHDRQEDGSTDQEPWRRW